MDAIILEYVKPVGGYNVTRKGTEHTIPYLDRSENVQKENFEYKIHNKSDGLEESQLYTLHKCHCYRSPRFKHRL